MERNIKKLLTEYEKLRNTGKGVVYCSDLKEIADMEQGSLIEKLYTSMKVGVALGYRIAIRDIRKKKAPGR